MDKDEWLHLGALEYKRLGGFDWDEAEVYAETCLDSFDGNTSIDPVVAAQQDASTWDRQ